MKLITEEIADNKKMLIIAKRASPFAKDIASQAKNKGVNSIISHTVPDASYEYLYVIILVDELAIEVERYKKINLPSENILFITYDKKSFLQLNKSPFEKAVKKMHIGQKQSTEKVIDTLFWFAFISKDTELDIDSGLAPKQKKINQLNQISRNFSTKKLALYVFTVVFIIQTVFIIPLIFSSYYMYKTYRYFMTSNYIKAEKTIQKGKKAIQITEKAFSISRPLISFFFIAHIPDNLIGLESDAFTIFDISTNLLQKGSLLSDLILKDNKSESDILLTENTIEDTNQQIKDLTSVFQSFSARFDYKLPIFDRYKTQVANAYKALEDAQRFTPYIKELLGEKSKKTYIIFFYNNMELRPGGGFIGSFAKVVFDKYTMEEFTVYDVYDADGQLKAHVEPPKAIKQYLKQPHWFLRDSNFSPDFYENITNASFFLKKTLDIDEADGYIAITTTALSYILEAYGSLHIADTNETITADNFYLSTQSYIHDDFFEGSKRKSTILSSMFRAMILQTNKASQKKLAVALKKSLDEKQLLAYFTNNSLQKQVDALRWGGKLLLPACVTKNKSCIVNYLFPVDANLGVNKTNYYIRRFNKLAISIDRKGKITSIFSVLYKNNSPQGVFPAGRYINYFQLYLPQTSEVKYITVNDKKINEFDELNNGNFKIVGFLIEIPSQESKLIEIAYSQTPLIPKGESVYQIMFQKQAGLVNTDFTLDLQLPDNISVIDQNFYSIAKEGKIIYNTTLSDDRIFIINVVKK